MDRVIIVSHDHEEYRQYWADLLEEDRSGLESALGVWSCFDRRELNYTLYFANHPVLNDLNSERVSGYAQDIVNFCRRDNAGIGGISYCFLHSPFYEDVEDKLKELDDCADRVIVTKFSHGEDTAVWRELVELANHPRRPLTELVKAVDDKTDEDNIAVFRDWFAPKFWSCAVDMQLLLTPRAQTASEIGGDPGASIDEDDMARLRQDLLGEGLPEGHASNPGAGLPVNPSTSLGERVTSAIAEIQEAVDRLNAALASDDPFQHAFLDGFISGYTVIWEVTSSLPEELKRNRPLSD